MSALFDAPTPISQLSPDSAYAFDPTGLALAGREVGSQYHFPAVLGDTPSTVLAELAVIQATQDLVTVTIDTGLLAWPAELRPQRSEFTGYSEDDYYGISFPQRVVGDINGHPITRMPMRTDNGGRVTFWCTELDQLGDYVSAFDLLQYAQHAMGQWRHIAKIPRCVQIPALELTYQSEIFGLGPVTLQRFAVGIDETGARVIAQTGMVTGALAQTKDTAEPVVFGAHGPVLMWFSASDSTLPFSIIGTTSDAWLSPESFVDLRNLEFPEWSIVPRQKGPVVPGGIVDKLRQGMLRAEEMEALMFLFGPDFTQSRRKEGTTIEYLSSVATSHVRAGTCLAPEEQRALYAMYQELFSAGDQKAR
ncbi:hypothetical protein QP027_06420 [Corynebacterium breve]|uniref:Uncharacterized protein n=1 Tax=Corynebacterium breve TaxID=3049799 RepID=A0ABY8VCE8_9CORY|nr:hypothetical protein [Corynebacterium breve]WIM66772.1 hypothetical protein QP027_06420 [Corynebacterium breve]